MDLSIVIPVYGSQETLRPLTDRLCTVLDGTGRDYEIIFVNDDSPDAAWDIIQSLYAQRRNRIRAIRLSRNFGQHNALMCGFRQARGKFVVTMDDDLQHPPEEVPKLIDAIERGELDVVYGRYRAKKHERWRNLGSYALNAVYRRVFSIRGEFTAFRIIRREFVQAALTYDLNFTFIDGLLAWNTRKIGGVEVEHAERSTGKSGYSLSRLMVLSLNMLTNFSILPLQLATLMGLVASAAGFGVGVYYLIRALMGSVTVPGYASLITGVLFLGGIQLLAIGMIGEYVGRLHLNVSRKPQYHVRTLLSALETSTSAEISHEP
jgi:undecaprenyl-phosphate 4-deoxy-4-formamido-L-arabinose transferase